MQAVIRAFHTNIKDAKYFLGRHYSDVCISGKMGGHTGDDPVECAALVAKAKFCTFRQAAQVSVSALVRLEISKGE